ncbi:MAG: ABC transporter substrate binding protein, partial [Candidatus Aminicenantales bacterium]
FLRSVEFGACAALGFDFYDMGLKTGRLAVRVKNGESPGALPIESMDAIKLYINPEAAARQGVVFTKDLLGRAARIVSQAPGGAAAPGPVLD